MPRTSIWCAADASGDDVGQQLAFQADYLILQEQFPLLQPLYLDLIERPRLDQVIDDVVQVPVLQPQVFKLFFYGVGIVHGARCK